MSLTPNTDVDAAAAVIEADLTAVVRSNLCDGVPTSTSPATELPQALDTCDGASASSPSSKIASTTNSQQEVEFPLRASITENSNSSTWAAGGTTPSTTSTVENAGNSVVTISTCKPNVPEATHAQQSSLSQPDGGCSHDGVGASNSDTPVSQLGINTVEPSGYDRVAVDGKLSHDAELGREQKDTKTTQKTGRLTEVGESVRLKSKRRSSTGQIKSGVDRRGSSASISSTSSALPQANLTWPPGAIELRIRENGQAQLEYSTRAVLQNQHDISKAITESTDIIVRRLDPRGRARVAEVAANAAAKSAHIAGEAAEAASKSAQLLADVQALGQLCQRLAQNQDILIDRIQKLEEKPVATCNCTVM